MSSKKIETINDILGTMTDRQKLQAYQLLKIVCDEFIDFGSITIKYHNKKITNIETIRKHLILKT